MRIGLALAEVLSPIRCAGCDLPGAALCATCAARLPRIDVSDACIRCGASDARRGCSECRDRTFAFTRAVCAGELDGPLSRAITLYKDAGERRYASLLCGLLSEACEPWRGWSDAVCAIPPSREAMTRRGFDHTSVLAATLAKHLDVPAIAPLTIVRKLDQRALGRDERFANVRDSFQVSSHVRIPRHVLLVDDVLTTGATLSGAARALLGAGAEEVRVAAIARA